MKNTVIIKGNKYGITIVLDETTAFSQLVTDLSSKLENAENFFDSDRQLAVTFQGRELSNEEMDELLYVIQNHSKLNIQYVMEQNSDLEVTFFDIIQTAKNLEEIQNSEDNSATHIEYDDRKVSDIPFESFSYSADASDNSGLFYRGTLRSGQSLEAKDSLIIIGDVNPGASVIAGGNIVVIGALKGSVIAGAYGNRNAFVMALSMTPLSIQISDVLAKHTDTKKTVKNRQTGAMIATIINNQISIEKVSKTMTQDINM